MASLATVATADVVRDDFRLLGDGAVVYDSSTNLDWLSLPFTGSLSVSQVTDRLGTDYAGFRYGSALEVNQLFEDAGVVGSLGTGFNVPLANFSELWGQLLGGSYASGFTSDFFTSDADPADPLQRSFGRLSISTTNWSVDTQFGTFYSAVDADYAPQNFGHALVREHIEIPVVPEPATGMLLVVGLLGLSWLNRRRPSLRPPTRSGG